MKVFAILILYLSGINASIFFNIINENDEVNVKYKGIEVKEVTQRELIIFGVPMWKLRDAVKSYFGKDPDHVFLAEKFPYGHVHQDYCWEPVSVVTTVKSATVSEVLSQPTVLATHDFDNDSNKTANVESSIRQEIENSISMSWTENFAVAMSLEVKSVLNFIIAKAGAAAGFKTSFTSSVDDEQSETRRVAATVSIKRDLLPGQSIQAILAANQRIIRVQVVYRANLRGILVISFSEPHDGHYYWGVPIEKILSNIGIRNEITTVGEVKLGYYTNIKTKIKDIRTDDFIN